MKKLMLILMGLSVMFSGEMVFAKGKLSGMDVMMKVYNRKAPKDQKSTLTMKLISRSGSTRIRKIKQYVKNFGRVEKKIMFFLSPADVKNTSFMNWSYTSSKSDDQWIYLPAIRRVKRISSDSKSDYFMGSDFTYDDLGDRHPKMDTHKILREEKFNGENCIVVESRSKNRDYMYSKRITWIIKDKWIGMQSKFYDEDGEFLKTLSVKSFKKIKGYWMILHSKMHNVQKNHKTEMILKNVKVNTGVRRSKFTERMMKRGI